MRKIDVLFAAFISVALIGFWVFISPMGTARVSEAAPTNLVEPTQQADGKDRSSGTDRSNRSRDGAGAGDDAKLTVEQVARRDALKRMRLERERSEAQNRERKLSASELSRLKERRRDTPPEFSYQEREFTPPPADAPRLPSDSSSRISTRPVFY